MTSEKRQKVGVESKVMGKMFWIPPKLKNGTNNIILRSKYTLEEGII